MVQSSFLVGWIFLFMIQFFPSCNALVPQSRQPLQRKRTFSSIDVRGNQPRHKSEKTNLYFVEDGNDESISSSRRRISSAPSSLPASIYVGNLPYATTEEQIRMLISPHIDHDDAIESIDIPKDSKSGKSKGFSYVKLKSIDDCANVITALQGSELDGRSIQVTLDGRSILERLKQLGTTWQDPSNAMDHSRKITLHVSNISLKATEEELKEFLVTHGFGHIYNLVRPRRKKTGRPGGFAFVTVDTDRVTSLFLAAVSKSLQFHNQYLKLEYANSPSYC